MMLRVLSFCITLPLSLFVILFAIANTGDVTARLAFFDISLDMPQYVLSLGLMALGFICGGVMVWLNLYGYRIRYWQAQRKIAKYEGEITMIKERQMEKSRDLVEASAPVIPHHTDS